MQKAVLWTVFFNSLQCLLFISFCHARRPMLNRFCLKDRIVRAYCIRSVFFSIVVNSISLWVVTALRNCRISIKKTWSGVNGRAWCAVWIEYKLTGDWRRVNWISELTIRTPILKKYNNKKINKPGTPVSKTAQRRVYVICRVRGGGRCTAPFGFGDEASDRRNPFDTDNTLRPVCARVIYRLRGHAWVINSCSSFIQPRVSIR